MRVVFFDIECASVSKTSAKICAFGYVVTDEAFRIVEQRDILINPRGGFHLTDRKGERGLVLPYEYRSFSGCPTFERIYPEIKALLEGADLVVGHAVTNDVKYLCLETERYRLPSFTFSYADTQLLFMTRQNSFERQPGLETVIENMGVEFTPHRAVDDAYATMRIAEALCKEEQVSLSELLIKYGMRLGKIENYVYGTPTTRAEIEWKREVHRKKAERAKRHDEFFRYLNKKGRKKKRRMEGPLVGKAFCFSRLLEEDIDRSKGLLDEIYARGGTYTTFSECNVYVSLENETGEKIKRAMESAEIDAITLQDFMELL
ncbi:MAG: hypothetical protein J5993_01810 [Clostridia bacterium]|nr:hypothetical protein [Clostridia bacterium]